MRRIVVTGMGAISPLGVGVEPVWARLLDGQSGIRQLPADIVQDLPVKVGGLVPHRTWIVKLVSILTRFSTQRSNGVLIALSSTPSQQPTKRWCSRAGNLYRSPSGRARRQSLHRGLEGFQRLPKQFARQTKGGSASFRRLRYHPFW